MCISLCMIVKNEEKHLPRCLASVSAHVDELVVVDTGSSDGTLDVARRYGAKLSFFSWTGDFSEARNYALSLVQGSWVLFLDADEELIIPQKDVCLKTICEKTDTDAFSVPIRNFHQDGSFDVHYAVRLFRKLPGIRFEGRAHEVVDTWLIRFGRKIISAPFIINHYGYAISQEDLRRKLLRNLESLQRQLAENPKDPVAHYRVGSTLYDLGDRDEARRALKTAYALQPPTEVIKCMILNLLCLDAYESKDYALVEHYARRSLATIPHQNTAHLYLGLSLVGQRRHKEAFPHLWRAYQFGRLPVLQRRTALTQEHFYKEEALLGALAVAARDAGQEALAAQFFRKYHQTFGKTPEALAHEGLSLLHCGAFAQAATCLEQASTLGMPMEDVAPPLAYAYFRSGRPREALAVYRRYKQSFDRDTAGRHTAALVRAWAARKFSNPEETHESSGSFCVHDCA